MIALEEAVPHGMYVKSNHVFYQDSGVQVGRPNHSLAWRFQMVHSRVVEIRIAREVHSRMPDLYAAQNNLQQKHVAHSAVTANVTPGGEMRVWIGFWL